MTCSTKRIGEDCEHGSGRSAGSEISQFHFNLQPFPMSDRRFLQPPLIVLFSLFLHQSLAVEFAITGSQFTLNGKPTFLYGTSYYAGLGASEELVSARSRRHPTVWLQLD